MTKEQIKRGAIFGVCLFSIVFFSIVARTYRTFFVLKKEKSAQLHKLQNKKSDIARIQKSLQQFEVEKKEFSAHLLLEKDVPAFLDGIAQYAQKASVNISDMKTKRFQEVTVPDWAQNNHLAIGKATTRQKKQQAQNKGKLDQMLTLAAMSIQFKVDATFSSFVKFLGYLEEFKQLVSISKVEIKRKKDYPYLQCGFTLNIYSLKTLAELE